MHRATVPVFVDSEIDGRGRRRPADSNQPEPKRRQAMTWAQRLKRVFRIDIDKSAGQPICTVADCREAVGHRDVPDDTCEHCGGAVRIIASIEDPAVIEKILAYIERRDAASSQAPRSPPATSGGDSP
jgi:hypothetical protein